MMQDDTLKGTKIWQNKLQDSFSTFVQNDFLAFPGAKRGRNVRLLHGGRGHRVPHREEV